MKTIGIAASGPSLTREDCNKLRQNCDEVIAVNDTWRMVPDAQHLYGADQKWWKHHISDVANDFNGKCWSCETDKKTNWGKESPDAWGVTALIGRIGDTGLSKDPQYVVTGGNSGYQAINLAYHLGAQRIILIGFDMHWHSGKAHWFGDHPKGLNNVEPNRYVEAFRTIKPEDYGLEIINCSRVTLLDAFP